LSLLHIVVVALVQGITEFLPISSSAHLILVPVLFDWPDQGALVDIAVHVGTLGAVVVYWWRDIVGLIRGFWFLLRGRMTPDGRLLLLLVLATVPVVVAGYVVVRLDLMAQLRSVEVIAWATIGFALLLFVVDRTCMTVNRLDHVGVAGALLLGLAQALALIPGTSRAGIVITAGRLLGLERGEAARISMLMSVPTILAAGAFAGRELAAEGQLTLQADPVVAAIIAFVSALLAISLMMRWLQRSSYLPFVLYRLALGAGLLYWANA